MKKDGTDPWNETDQVLLEIQKTEKYLDRIAGSLIGGAVGDALGFPVEFLSHAEITGKYGPKGITTYELDKQTGKALISDDTQMTLFTANAILMGETRLCLRGIGGMPSGYAPQSYQDWLTTQLQPFEKAEKTKRYNGNGGLSWLLDVPELYHKRAPGNTCMKALIQQREAPYGRDFIECPINDSKGCGGIMRVAPLGLHYRDVDIEELDREGAALAAITHGHSLGYMPAAVLTHILNRNVYPKNPELTLREIVLEAQKTVGDLFRGDWHLDELNHVIDLAIELSQNHKKDLSNIKQIGEGWVAEETLGISLYCALRYEHDFSGGVIAAVNHSGDSDSTGAVTGNILGAINGYAAIEEKWKKDLELHSVLMEMALDLCHGCHMSEMGSYDDPEWHRKYVYMFWKPKNAYVFFWHANEENGYLSNGYPCKIQGDDFCYHSAQQYLMAEKARLFHDTKILQEIQNTSSPSECVKLGRKIQNYDMHIWGEARYEILQKVLTEKFKQNEDLRKKLLDTGSKILAQASPYDGVYGIKMTAKEAGKVGLSQWEGENLLGNALMDVRESLMEKTEELRENEDFRINRENLEDGNFLLALKMQYGEEQTEENMLALLSCLRDSTVWVPMQAIVSQRDQQSILDTVMKDGTIQVEPEQEWVSQDEIRLKPDILQSPDNTLWFPIFSQETQMPENYRERFSAIPMTVLDTIQMAHNTENVVGIVLDAFSDVNITMPFELADLIPELPSNLSQNENSSDM